MKLVEAAVAQLLHLVGQHGGGDDAAGFHILVQPVIGAWTARREWRRRPWPPCAPRRLKLVVGMMPGMMGMVMPALAASSRKRAVGVIVEAELAQRAAGARVHLGLEQFDVMAVAGRIRMAFGIKGDADLEGRDAADARDQFRRGAGSRRDAGDRAPPCRACRRAAPRYGGCRRPNSPARSRRSRPCDAPTQVRCAAGLRRGLLDNALDGGMGALARGTARAIGHRDKSGRQRLQPLDRGPQLRLPPPRSWAARIRTTPQSGAFIRRS